MVGERNNIKIRKIKIKVKSLENKNNYLNIGCNEQYKGRLNGLYGNPFDSSFIFLINSSTVIFSLTGFFNVDFSLMVMVNTSFLTSSSPITTT